MPDSDEKPSQPLDYEQPAKPVEPVSLRYRKVFSNILVSVGLGIGIFGVFARNADIASTALALIVCGIIIRFQHVRL